MQCLPFFCAPFKRDNTEVRHLFFYVFPCQHNRFEVVTTAHGVLFLRQHNRSQLPGYATYNISPCQQTDGIDPHVDKQYLFKRGRLGALKPLFKCLLEDHMFYIADKEL